MNKRQYSQLNMFRTVIAVCDMNSTSIADVPAFGANFKSFKKLIEEAHGVSTQIRTTTTGVAVNKAALKKALATRSAAMAAILQSLAVAIGSEKLFAESKYAPSKLSAMGDQRFIESCEVIRDNASAQLKNLKDYKVTKEVVDALTAQIKQYKDAIPSMNVAMNQQKVNTSELGELFAKANHLLKNHLDKITVQFENTHPDFIKVYKNARKLKDLGSKKEVTPSVSGTVKGTEGPVEGAVVEIVETEMVTSTNEVGSFEFRDVVAGTYTLRVTYKGYKTTEALVSVAQKENVSRNIVLVKA